MRAASGEVEIVEIDLIEIDVAVVEEERERRRRRAYVVVVKAPAGFAARFRVCSAPHFSVHPV